MGRTDGFRMAPDDGLKYHAPEREQERRDREIGYVVLLVVVILVLIGTVTGHTTVFYH